MAMAPPRVTSRVAGTLASAIRAAGIVGAGGAGFPTYVKFTKPTPILLVNCAESEPGYYADKLLIERRAAEFAELFVTLRNMLGYEDIVVGAEEGAKPWLVELERLANETGAFRMSWFENVYKYGQERALAKRVLGIVIPPRAIPPSVGLTVSNVESLWNVHQAIFAGKPVTTKFLTVFGETPTHRCFEAPVGALACDLLALAGLDAPDGTMRLYDGGPVLCDEIPDWPRASYGIRRTTNGLLLVAAERAKARARSYPLADGPPPPTRIEDVTGRVARVRVPLAAGYGEPARPVASVGDEVARGEVIAEDDPARLSVPVHASIAGIVTQVDEAAIEIHARRPSP